MGDRLRRCPIRFWGRLTDGLVLLVPQVAIRLVLRSAGAPIALVNLASFALVVAYDVVQLSRDGTTIGKRAAGTRVVRTSGVPLDTATVLLRTVVLEGPGFLLPTFVPSAGPFVALASLVVVLPILFGSDRRGLHDRAAGTQVVRTA